jgi:hypothetical protein
MILAEIVDFGKNSDLRMKDVERERFVRVK